MTPPHPHGSSCAQRRRSTATVTCVEQQVWGLEVAVQHGRGLGVQVLHPAGDVQRHRQLRLRIRPSPRPAVALVSFALVSFALVSFAVQVGEGLRTTMASAISLGISAWKSSERNTRALHSGPHVEQCCVMIIIIMVIFTIIITIIIGCMQDAVGRSASRSATLDDESPGGTSGGRRWLRAPV